MEHVTDLAQQSSLREAKKLVQLAFNEEIKRLGFSEDDRYFMFTSMTEDCEDETVFNRLGWTLRLLSGLIGEEVKRYGED